MTAKMEAAKAARDVRARLEKQKDGAYLEQIRRLVPGIRTYGVRVPIIRAAVREAPQMDFESACALMDELCRGGVRDEILYGAFLLSRAKYRKAIASMDWQNVIRWLNAVDNWETCDQIAMTLAGPHIAADVSAAPKLIALTGSKNVWHRRFALAAAASLNQKGRSFPDITLRICTPLMGDKEPTIQKAIGWAIREASEHDEEAAYRFLLHNKDETSRAVLREGSQKLAKAKRDRLLG